MSLLFLKALGERAAKTFCQALAAALLAGGTGLLEVGWMQALSMAGMATLLSVLTSIGSSQVGGTGSPSALPGGETPLPIPGAHERLFRNGDRI